MNHEPFFLAEDAEPLQPIGTCSRCGVTEDPTVAVFWDNGACPTCTGAYPLEGYSCAIFYTRRDRAPGLERIIGPYTPAEAARAAAHLLTLENVKTARVAAKPEWWA